MRRGDLRQDPRKRFRNLLGSPFSFGMRRHIEVNGVTALMGQHYEDKQQVKTDCRHHQEINRHNCPAWFSRKCATFARVAFVDASCTWLQLLGRSVSLVSTIHHESSAHPTADSRCSSA